jgi:Flp pilus assembly protein TadB
MDPGRRPRHPALVARVLTAGLSLAAALGIVAVMARDSQRRTATAATSRTVEVRIGEDVSDAEARAALRAWLEGQPDLDRDGGLTVVDSPPDTTTAPS